jgi:hypothetical protein
MSGGMWNYLQRRLDDAAENLDFVARPSLRLLGQIEHELDWGQSGDTCPDCAALRVTAGLLTFFGDDLGDEAAIAVLRDRQAVRNWCSRCLRRLPTWVRRDPDARPTLREAEDELARRAGDSDDVLSNISSTVDGKLRRMTWREVAEERDRVISRLYKWSQICADLDRCEHGRHEGDVCDQCRGPSHGNPLLGVDRQIGYDIGGLPICVPLRGDGKGDPENWNPRRQEARRRAAQAEEQS